MGVEVKGAGDGVVIADRGCNDGDVEIIQDGALDGEPLVVHW
jgi:hypothetical protein|nr:MAG TPA: hypothetical protein [Caudoviricetes sp.]